MQINDHIHGFTVTACRRLEELKANLWEMTYEKNGARLVWLDRADNNKTFAITFKTIPEDDTGVFHILEHSVLCGSDKYPVKEPFVELLKGSLNTFLNALTFPDKTMYPVSSRNDKDFLNLVDVYMDAVLHPAIYQKPEIFRQEGWHYAFEEDKPTYNGVVFNEMKGAYSDVETVMYQELTRRLFPDNCYRFSSGGDPARIPDLTYEQFIRCHETYYHPSNAYIFLDGAVALNDTLALLDSFLGAYDFLAVDSDIPMQAPVAYTEGTCPYEVADAADEGRVQMVWGYNYGTFADNERATAMRILTDVLCGSNEAPLKKAVLDAALAEDIYFQSDDGTQQQLLMLEVRNTTADKVEAVKKTVADTLLGLVQNGLDKAQLTAALNCLEFRVREKDYGSYPRGVVYAMTMMESWLYGGDPAQNLCCDALFASLREKIGGCYFEELLQDTLLKDTDTALLVLTASASLGEEKQAAEEARLTSAAAAWSDEERARFVAQEDALKAAQLRQDAPEELATLPKLTIADVTELPEDLPQTVERLCSCEVLRHNIDTDGIVYIRLFFSLAGLSPEELSCVSFLSDLLGQAATAHYDRLTLQTVLRDRLGDISFAPTAYARDGKADEATPYLVASVSVLESKKNEAVALLGEILCASQLDDKALLLQILRQRKLADEENLTMAGHRYALGRVAAACSAEGAMNEYLSGLESSRWVRRQEERFETHADTLIADLAALYSRIFVRERLTVSVTGPVDESYCRALASLVPMAGVSVKNSEIPLLPMTSEGVRIPAPVAFAVAGSHLSKLDAPYNGALRVAANLISLQYLWNSVRVQGGAYGTGFLARPNGTVAMYSYRDPQPARSLDCYAQAAAFLEQFCDGDEDLEPYIIGAVAAVDPLLTPNSKGMTATVRWLCGRSYEDVCRLQKEILSTDRDQLRELCAMLRRLAEKSVVCVVGGKERLGSCGDKLKTIGSLQEN